MKIGYAYNYDDDIPIQAQIYFLKKAGIKKIMTTSFEKVIEDINAGDILFLCVPLNIQPKDLSRFYAILDSKDAYLSIIEYPLFVSVSEFGFIK